MAWLGELLMGVGEYVVNKWDRGLGLGERALALSRSQVQILPPSLLLLIGAKKDCKFFLL
jgi:hypothetical protein